MHTYVSPKTTSISKRFLTHITCKRAFSGMHAYVIIEITSFIERFLTNITRERAFCSTMLTSSTSNINWHAKSAFQSFSYLRRLQEQKYLSVLKHSVQVTLN